jgi:signal transduction histidine kinase
MITCEIFAAFERAGWPVFVTDADGVIQHANDAARSEFAGDLAASSSALDSLAAPHASEQLTALLVGLCDGPQKPVPIACRAGRGERTFTVSGMVFEQDGRELRLLQFLPAPAAAAGLDANAAQKQKLDCALQLTRTVALDFNNALTSILGHTSLLISQVPADNAWRSSLIEIEKSAEKAAEIAYDLAVFSRQEKDVRSQQAGNLNNIVRRSVDAFKTPQLAQIT